MRGLLRDGMGLFVCTVPVLRFRTLPFFGNIRFLVSFFGLFLPQDEQPITYPF